MILQVGKTYNYKAIDGEPMKVRVLEIREHTCQVEVVEDHKYVRKGFVGTAHNSNIYPCQSPCPMGGVT